jgi:upstream activation factor subunit UAF30
MAKKAKKKSKRKPSAAFMAPMRPSEALAAIVGSKPLPRTQAVKKLWQYIKRKKLQDKKNKRQINPDAALAKVFGSSRSMNMFAMMKVLKKNLKK